MGKLARIQELEAQVEYWKRRADINSQLRGFIETIAELPEDAVLLYTLTGQRMSFELSKAARRMLEKA
jgi:hypothetical protein